MAEVGPFLIQAHTVLEKVETHFRQLSGAQWIMLAQGIFNPSTDATLAEMLCNIAQGLAIDVLRQVASKYLEGDANLGGGGADVILKEPMDAIFAAVLRVPQQTCESANTLSSLLEKEVSLRLNSAFSLLSAGAVSPGSSLYIPGNLSSVCTLCEMVLHASITLKALLKNVDLGCRFFGLCSWQRPQSDKDRLQIYKSAIIKPKTLKSVTHILLKWSQDKNAEILDASPTASPDTQAAASNIVKKIIQRLYSDVESSSPRPPLNPRLIVLQVRKFFKSIAEKSPGMNESKSWSCFQRFARKRFTEMKAKLTKALQRPTDFLVSLGPDCEPGRGSSMLDGGEIMYPLFEFDLIEGHLQKWFNRFSRPEERWSSGSGADKNTEDDIIGISLKVSEQMSQHLAEQNPPPRRAGLTLNTLRMITDDLLVQFVQLMLLWLQTQPLRFTVNAEEACGAADDIIKFIAKQLTPAVEGEEEAPGTNENLTTDRTWLHPPAEKEKYQLSVHLMHSLVLQLFWRLPEKSVQMNDVQYVIARLCDCATVETIYPLLDSVQTINKMEEVTLAVMKDVLLEFTSPAELKASATSRDDDAFIDVVLRNLVKRLTVGTDDKPKKSKIPTAFSVGIKHNLKSLRRPPLEDFQK